MASLLENFQDGYRRLRSRLRGSPTPTQEDIWVHIENITGDRHSPISTFLFRIMENTEGAADVIEGAQPRVRILTFLMLARHQHDAQFASDSKGQQWASNNVTALGYYGSAQAIAVEKAAGYLGVRSHLPAAYSVLTSPSSWSLAAPAVASTAGYFAVTVSLGMVFFKLAEYFDSVRNVATHGHHASYGQAYRALFIDEDIGTLVDDAHEPAFIDYLVRVILGMQESKAPIPFPEHDDDDTQQQRSAWAAAFSRWANNEFRAWIALWFRVKVARVPPGSSLLQGAAQKGDVWGPAATHSPHFVDLTTWQARLTKRHATQPADTRAVC